jgi:hypothetical protein
VTFIVFCVIWHRYIIENQYISWTLGIGDTIIPMGFAVGQSAMAAAITRGNALFCWAYAALFFWGVFAYANALIRHRHQYVQQIYRWYFLPLGSAYGEKFLRTFVKHERESFWELLAGGVVALFPGDRNQTEVVSSRFEPVCDDNRVVLRLIGVGSHAWPRLALATKTQCRTGCARMVIGLRWLTMHSRRVPTTGHQSPSAASDRYRTAR